MYPARRKAIWIGWMHVTGKVSELLRRNSAEMGERMNLREQIRQYTAYNEQEEKDQQMMLDFLDNGTDVFLRSNWTAHFTASSWVLNQEHTKVLMIYHNIYHSWSWTGGHADGEEDLLSVAVREVQEETGVKEIRVVNPDIFSLEVLCVEGHEKRGSYVPCHLHFNVTYLLEADEEDVLRVKPDENSGVRWFGFQEALEACTEPWMKERIYQKLNDKLKRLDEIITIS